MITKNKLILTSGVVKMNGNDMERFWVKVSLGAAHIHDRITNQQWETVNKLQKKFNLTLEKLGDW